MDNLRLTEARVHALIKTYAADHAGNIPSSTEILALNDGHGSLQSANKYRKTYLKQHPLAGAANRDPFAGFPAAIADAANAMRETLERDAHAQIEAAQTAAAESIQIMQAQLEEANHALRSLRETDYTLRAHLREATEDKTALIEQNRRLSEQLEERTAALNTCTTELAARQAELTGCRTQIDELTAIRDDVAPLLRDQQRRLTALGEHSRTLADAATTLQNGQETAVDTVTHQITALSTGLSQNHQQLAELSRANRDAIKAADHQRQQDRDEIAQLHQTLDEQRARLEQARHATREQSTDALAAKVDASHDLMRSLIETVATLQRTLPAEVAASLNDPQGEA